MVEYQDVFYYFGVLITRTICNVFFVIENVF